MTERHQTTNSQAATLIAVSTFIGSYLPLAMSIDAAMKWLRPIGHAEELMGRELEALLITGPLAALILAFFAGWIVRRRTAPVSTSIALAAFLASLAIAALTAKWINLL